LIQRKVDQRLCNRRETSADFHQRPGFYSLDQLNKNVIENADLLFVQAIRFAQEEIGDLPQHGYALFR
jgi:hypothetical protein